MGEVAGGDCRRHVIFTTVFCGNSVLQHEISPYFCSVSCHGTVFEVKVLLLFCKISSIICMIAKYFIGNLPTINSNINLNDHGISNDTVSKERLSVIVERMNQKLDEYGDDAMDFKLNELTVEKILAEETLRDNCRNLTGVVRICNGVFIEEMNKQINFGIERIPAVAPLNTDVGMKKFLEKIIEWSYGKTEKELTLLAIRKPHESVWYQAFKPAFDVFLPGRDNMSDQDKKELDLKLTWRIMGCYSKWRQSKFSLNNDEDMFHDLVASIKEIRKKY